MKFSVFALFVPLVVSFAVEPGADYELDSYVYDSSEVFSNIPNSYDDYAVIDDFTPAQGCEIVTYSCWGVTTDALPAELELLVVEDSSGVPSGVPVQTVFPTTFTDTGQTFAGQTLYLAVLDLSASPLYVATNETVWLGSHRNDGSSWYVACGTTVSGSEAYTTVSDWYWQPISSWFQEGDLFKIIDGSVSIDGVTWGSIKTMF